EVQRKELGERADLVAVVQDELRRLPRVPVEGGVQHRLESLERRGIQPEAVDAVVEIEEGLDEGGDMRGPSVRREDVPVDRKVVIGVRHRNPPWLGNDVSPPRGPLSKMVPFLKGPWKEREGPGRE